MYIKRDLEKIVLALSKEYPAILITGPRQVGKTTMLKHLMEGTNRSYVSLDNHSDRALAKNDPALFLQLHKPPLLIDEVQYAPELFSYLKIQIDERQSPGDYWLTGSQIFRLMRGVQESLAGRMAILSLSSLSQNEITATTENRPFSVDLDFYLEKQKHVPSQDVLALYEQMFSGSMPAVVSGKHKNLEIFYTGYINTYLERDIHALSDSIDSLKFFKFMTAVAARCGLLLNVADIAQDAEIDQRTVKNWLNILETLGILFYLHPYSNNQLKRTIKTPKIYFFDTGLICFLTKWSSAEVLERGAMNGAILENYVVSEVIKGYQNAGQRPFLYYYRDQDAKEIDIILERDGKLHPIEIKKTASPTSHLTKTFAVLDKSKLIRGMGAILCLHEKVSAIDRENLIIPIWLI